MKMSLGQAVLACVTAITAGCVGLLAWLVAYLWGGL